MRLLIALALTLASCIESEPEPPRLPSAAEAAGRFATAWEERDADALEELADEPHEAERFLRWDEKARAGGRITGVSVDVPADIDQPTPAATPTPIEASVVVPYSVTWTSEAADDPVVFEGELALVLDGDRWTVELERELLFPEHPGASSFTTTSLWLRRGRILDRDGRVLARGRPDRRRYPQASTGGMFVGHIGIVTRRDVKGGSQFERGDLVGRSGIEAAYQDRLAGEPELRLHVRTRRRVVDRLGAVEGTPGRDVRTTLSVPVQRSAQAAFGGTTGGAVVMDPSTGNILAAVPGGTFDPSNYVGAKDVQPFDRSLEGLYPPGSTLKVMTAAAALDTGVVTPGTKLTGPPEFRGVRNFESGSFGMIDFATAVKFSVNTAFAQVALDLGPRRLKRYADAFGFNEEPAMELNAAVSSFPRPLDEGDLMWSSVGQAQTLATPLEMASVAATIANGGKRMQPRAAFLEPKQGERAVKGSTARTMTTLMRSVVTGGTGVNAQISGIDVAGKTGTAEVDVAGERRNHAWFVAFAPAGEPLLAVAVVSEYGGVGGQVAAPLARSIINSVMPHLRR